MDNKQLSIGIKNLLKEVESDDNKYYLPGIDDRAGYDVFGGEQDGHKQGKEIKHAIIDLIRNGYAPSDILEFCKATIKAARQKSF